MEETDVNKAENLGLVYKQKEWMELFPALFWRYFKEFLEEPKTEQDARQV